LAALADRNLRDERRAVSAGERFGDVLLLDQLALRRDAELVHVVAAEHRRGVGVLAAGVRINLRVEHEHLHVRRFCRITFETFWKPMSPSAPSPPMTQTFGQFLDFLLGHQRVVEMRAA
jgi:hypothetical protein